MKVKCIDEGLFTDITLGKEYEVKETLRLPGVYEVVNGDRTGNMYPKILFEEVEKVEKYKKTEKTFKEVIRDIKKDEQWENNFKIIAMDKYGDITITNKDGCNGKTFVFLNATKYKLKGKTYSFFEAFKAYKEGKEIESFSTNVKYSKSRNIVCMRISEIKGEWYINE